jgi:hypothetical protein
MCNVLGLCSKQALSLAAVNLKALPHIRVLCSFCISVYSIRYTNIRRGVAMHGLCETKQALFQIWWCASALGLYLLVVTDHGTLERVE